MPEIVFKGKEYVYNHHLTAFMNKIGLQPLSHGRNQLLN